MRIIYFDLDSLRPDHLGCYGYSRNTSPNIDKIAAEGIRFENVYAADMPCMPSRTSLFSGRLGIHHGCVSHTGTRAEPFSEGPSRKFRSDWGRANWMRHLRDAGIKTVTFSAFGERHAAWHWYAGFEEIHDTGYFGEDIADHVTPGVTEWLEQNAVKDNWFLHVNLWDIHIPYRTPKEFGNQFADIPLSDNWFSQEILDEYQQMPGMRSAKDALFLSFAEKRPDINPPAIRNIADVKLMIDGYDTGIKYVDEHIGRIMTTLEKQGILDNTAIIISADHGECLGELNAFSGHCFADQCTSRIPLIIRWPGRVSDKLIGKSNDDLHYNIDLAPTVNELLGISCHESWDAESFADNCAGITKGREFLVLSQLAQTCQRSVRFRNNGRDYLFIRTYRHYFYQFDTDLLFDIGEDPHQQNNLAENHPGLVAEASSKLHQWHQEALQNSPNPDPLEKVLTEPCYPTAKEYCRRLRQTGREKWAELIQSGQAYI